MEFQKYIPCNCKACKSSQNPYEYEFNKLLERIANKKHTIECGNPPYYTVSVLNLIDNTIDLEQLNSPFRQDSNKSFHFPGDIEQLIFQVSEKGYFMLGNRNIEIREGNYNEHIADNYYEQKGNNNTMSNITQSHTGSGDNVAGDKNTTNNYNSQDLKQAAADIQALLEQLEQTYPTNTTPGKMAIATEAIERIDNDPKLTQRILSALKAGSISAFEQLLNHPAASFFLSALEDWQQSKSS